MLDLVFSYTEFMRTAARAIVIKDDMLLVIHRNKFGTEYDTLPGGRIEMGESPSEALIRELHEETGVAIANPQLVFIEHSGEPYGDQYIFLCDYISGEPRLDPRSIEAAIHQSGKNLYLPMWVELNDLANKSFVSPNLKIKLLEALASKWPTAPVEF